MALAPKLGFVGRAVQLDHGHVDGLLLDGVPADQRVGDLVVDVIDRLRARPCRT